MFRAIFAHLQERKTEIFTAYGIVSCCCGRQGFGERQRGTTCTVRRMLLGHYLLQKQDTIPYAINLSLTLLKMDKRLPETC